MNRRAMIDVMTEATRRGLTFELRTVEDLATGKAVGQVVALLDEEGEHIESLASRGDLADLGRFLGVLPRVAAVAA